jgi:hypothetical protein
MKAQRKHLIERKIIDILFRPFPNGRNGIAQNPIIILDNGQRLSFVVEETEVGEYGISLVISSKNLEGA